MGRQQVERNLGNGDYSHLKNLTAIPVQTTETADITTTGSHQFSAGKPRNADFISSIPCVNGNMLTIFCIMGGITSKGRVAPEKIIGARAITYVIISAFLDIPTAQSHQRIPL